jgi:hypothetical protein
MHKGVSVALVGFSNLEQVEEAVASSGKGSLSVASIERLKMIWSKESF